MANYDDYEDENQQGQGSEIDPGQLLDDAKDLYDRYQDYTSPDNHARHQNTDTQADAKSPQIIDTTPEQSELLSGNGGIPDVNYSAMRNSGTKSTEEAAEQAVQAQEATAEASEIGGITAETAEGMAEGAAKDVAVQAAEAGAEKGAEAAAGAAAEGAAAGAAEGAAAAGAEAGASTTGVGAVAVAILEALKVAGKAATSWGKIVTGETRKSGFGWIIWIILFLIMFNGSMSYTYKTTFGSVDENYIEGQYSDKFDIEDIDWGFSWFFNLFNDEEEDEVGEFDAELEFTEGCDKAKKYINRGFERALNIAKNFELPWIISKEGYDFELTMESYESEEEHFYEDMNYAEIIEVVQQKEELNSENLVYKEFKRLFNPILRPWKLQLLYRMKVEPDWAEKVIEHYDAEGNVTDSTTELVLYGKVTLKHYDLKSLYRFIEVDAFDYNAQVDNMQNITLLDESEENLRCYADYYDFGPYTRTPWDYGFEESGYVYGGELLKEFERIIIKDIEDEELKVGDIMFYSAKKNGRYKDVTHVAIYAGNDMMVDASSGKGVVIYRSVYSGLNPNYIVSICRPLPDDDEETRQQLLDFALSQCGKKYSQDLRTTEGYYDCSSFVAAVYRSVGIEFGGYAPVAADICKYNENAGNLIAISYPRKKR
jgi:hypothetical protein